MTIVQEMDPYTIPVPLDHNFDYTGIANKRQRIDEMEKYRFYIGSLIEQGTLKPGGVYKHQIPELSKCMSKPELIEYLMMDVLFWDLVEACNKKEIKFKLFCPECNSKLNPIPLGPKKRFMMRKLYGVEKTVLLITSMFRCCSAQKHELLGYDPRLLCSLPKLDIPFLLFHRAGTTAELVNLILYETGQGNKIHQIQDNLAQNYMHSFAKQREAYINACNLYEDDVFEDFPPYKPQCPSVTLVTQCCLTAFKDKEEYYRSSMQQVRAKHMFFLDDSFQVASSLQFPKTLSKKAIQFKRVMYVTNECGQVMAWQLTKNDSYQEVESVLNLIKERHEQPLVGCLTNRCCEWSQNFKNTFGSNFLVKGNIYLYLERITKGMPIDSDHRARCLNDLENVFRQTDKIEPVEKTPDSIMMQKKLDDFLLQWKDLKNHTGHHIIPPIALREIYALEQHINNGCLSDISRDLPVHSILGTHHAIQKWVANARIGIPLAMSLFSMGFHDLNKERGVMSLEVENSFGRGVEPTVPASVKLPDVRRIFERYLCELQEVSLENNKTNLKTLKDILMYINAHQSISRFVPDIEKLSRLIPYFMSPLHLISNPCFTNSDGMSNDYYKNVGELQHGINRVTKDSSLVEQENSNIISAIVNYLKTYFDLHCKKESTQKYFNFLLLQGIDFSQDCNTIIELVTSMIQLKELHAKITDTEDMLSVLANYFHVVIFYITNFKRFPILPVYPSNWNMNSPNIFLILRDELYLPVLLDLSTNKTTSVNVPLDSQLKNFRCRCGRGKADNNPKCVTLESQRYPSRCLCFRAGEACTSLCDCRSCNNPHGIRVTKTRIILGEKRTRKRHAHDGQKLFKDILSRATSWLPANQNTNASSWSALECLLFELTLSNIMKQTSEDVSFNSLSNLTLKMTVLRDYNKITDSLSFISKFCHVVFSKGMVDIEAKLLEREGDILSCLGMY